jgi:hypothetical protein
MRCAGVIILSLLSCFAHAQDSSDVACTPAGISCDVQTNKAFEVVKSRPAGKQSFIIKDSCYCFNRVVDTVDMYRAFHHPAYILSKEEVKKVETFLLSQPGAGTGKQVTKQSREFFRKMKIELPPPVRID